MGKERVAHQEKPAAEQCSAAPVFATGPTLLGYLLILAVVFAIFGIRDLFQDLIGEKRREHRGFEDCNCAA